MVARYRHRRTSNPVTAFPNPIEPGELVTNTANRQLVVGDANAGSLGVPVALIAVRYFDARAKYATDDLVQYQSNIFRARTANGPGAFNFSNWSQLTFPDADANLVQVGGDTMTGPLILAAGEPSNPTAAAPKSYVDSTAAAAAASAAAGKADKTYVDAADAALQTNVNVKADKTYVDAQDTALQTDKADKTYVDSQNATQDTAITGKVAKTGDTMSGPLNVPTQPVGDFSTKAATTAFVNQAQIILASVDLNTIVNPGTYACQGLSNNPNEPTGAGQWYVHVLAYGNDPNHVIQVAYSLITDGLVYTRKRAAGTWGAWSVIGAPTAATAAEYVGNTAPTKMLTPGAVWTATAPANNVNVSGAITPNFAAALDFIYRLIGNITLNNPTGGKPGQKGVILFVSDTTARTISWGTAYKFPGGVKPALSGANTVDALSYTVTSDGNTLYCNFSGAMA